MSNLYQFCANADQALPEECIFCGSTVIFEVTNAVDPGKLGVVLRNGSDGTDRCFVERIGTHESGQQNKIIGKVKSVYTPVEALPQMTLEEEIAAYKRAVDGRTGWPVAEELINQLIANAIERHVSTSC